MTVDHYAVMAKRLITQYKGLPNLDKDFQVMGEFLQDFESALTDVEFGTTLPLAVGVTLDRWGVILSTPRGGLGDDDYRGLLYARICQYNSQATPEDMIHVCRLLFQSDKVTYSEPFYPAKFRVEIKDPAAIAPLDLLVEAIMKSKPAGVLPYIQLEPTPVFSFLEDTDPDTAGFLEASDGGGYFSTLLIP